MISTLRRGQLALLTSLLVSASACQRAGQPAPADAPTPERPAPPEAQVERPADVSGEWDAILRLEGDPEGIPGVILIQQDGAMIDGAFSSPLGVNARGPGSMEGRRLRLVLAYDIECPGTATLVGTVSDDGDEVVGVVSASDCTGPVEGTFALNRVR